jgi:ribonuclease-3
LFAQLIARLGVDVNPQLLELAFTHRSFAYENNLSANNERLEFLGDAVLGLVVTEELYTRYPDLDESKLSPLRSGIVNMRALADIARELNLGQYMRIGKGEEITGGRDKNSLLADSLEALFGAIYLNHGFTDTARVILNLITPTIEVAKSQGAGLDGKTALQELAAARQISLPEYQISESGPDHDKSFVATAIVGGEAIATGSGKSKREAEQAAARTAFEILNARTS